VGISIKISCCHVFSANASSWFAVQLITNARTAIEATGPAARSFANGNRTK